MDKSKAITDEQASNVVGGSYHLGDPIPTIDFYITVFYCEKDNPSEVKTVWVLVTAGNSAIDAARAWCEANNKTYLDWLS